MFMFKHPPPTVGILSAYFGGSTWSNAESWPRLAVGAGFRFHVGAQDSVDAGLVAAAVFLQPLHDIVVNSDGEAVFGFGHGEPGGLPERFTELGDVGEVDVGIAHCAQPLKVRSSLCPSS